MTKDKTFPMCPECKSSDYIERANGTIWACSRCMGFFDGPGEISQSTALGLLEAVRAIISDYKAGVSLGDALIKCVDSSEAAERELGQ